MFRTMIQRVRQWQVHSDSIARLRALDDFILADMGIDREHISDLVRGKGRR